MSTLPTGRYRNWQAPAARILGRFVAVALAFVAVDHLPGHRFWQSVFVIAALAIAETVGRHGGREAEHAECIRDFVEIQREERERARRLSS